MISSSLESMIGRTQDRQGLELRSQELGSGAKSPPKSAQFLGRRILLLSPHADDVAYSIGGIVARLSMQADILLMTVFGRSRWALPPLCEESADTVSAVREQEDRAYCERRRIDYALLPCPDSFMMGYDEAEELSVAAADDPRTANTVKLIGDSVARLAPHIVLAPCGLGGHVDHQIVRIAADALQQVEVLYYEDVPYSASLPLAELDRQLTAQGLAPTVTSDIEIVLEDKCEDMWGYRSQTSESTIAEMLLHAGRVGMSAARYAERLWSRVNRRTTPQERHCRAQDRESLELWSQELRAGAKSLPKSAQFLGSDRIDLDPVREMDRSAQPSGELCNGLPELDGINHD